jgi:hypothetical protein
MAIMTAGEDEDGALALQHPEQREREQHREQGAQDIKRPPADPVRQPAEQRQADSSSNAAYNTASSINGLGKPSLVVA